MSALLTKLVLESKGILANVSLRGLRQLKEEELISARVRSFMIDMRLAGRYVGVFTHVPNEGKRSTQATRLLKAMGMVSGFCDWVFIGPWGNCVIELKAPKEVEKLRQTQIDFKEWCETDGVPHFVCTSVVEVEQALIKSGALLNYHQEAS